MKFVKLFAAVSILGILLALFLYSMRYEIARLKEGLPGFTHALGDEYFEMVKNKTAVLIGCSFMFGGIAAETNTIGSNVKFPSNKRFYAWNSVKKWLEEHDVPKSLTSPDCSHCEHSRFAHFSVIFNVTTATQFC